MTGDTPPGLVLSPTAQVGEGVRFGAHVVVHDDVVIGDGVVVQDGAILGKAPTLSPRSSMAGAATSEPLVIEEGAAICAQAIVFAGARIGRGTIVGDQAFVRERSAIGEGCVIGRGATVDCDVSIGSRVRIQSQVYITAFSVIEDDVFVGPCGMPTNADTMAGRPPQEPMRGATLRRACRIGGGAVLVPGVEVGEEAFVAAGAVVTQDVPARAFMVGGPGRQVREVRDDELLENWR